MARLERVFDPVQIAQIGSAAFGLEGAEATAAGALVLWGWLVDPISELRNLTCEVNGRTAAVEMLDRVARPDLAEMLAPLGPGGEPGFVAWTQLELEVLHAPDRQVTLRLETDQGFAVSRNRLVFNPARSFARGVGARLPLARMRPAAIARVGAAIRGPLEARAVQDAGQGARSSAFGPTAESRLSLVLPVQGAVPLAGEYGVLRQTLAYLDMDPDAVDLELVLVVADPALWDVVEQAVLDAAASLKVRIVRPSRELSVGAAAAIGVEAASAPQVALMSEAVVPPARDWIADVLSALRTSRWAGPQTIPRFDGLTHRFQLRSPAQGTTSWPHEAVRSRLLEAMRRRRLDSWSPHLVAGDRQALLRATVEAAQVGGDDAFWMALLDQALSEGAAPFASGAQFTFVPGAARGEDEAQAESLLDAYALAARLDTPERNPAGVGAA